MVPLVLSWKVVGPRRCLGSYLVRSNNFPTWWCTAPLWPPWPKGTNGKTFWTALTACCHNCRMLTSLVELSLANCGNKSMVWMTNEPQPACRRCWSRPSWLERMPTCAASLFCLQSGCIIYICIYIYIQIHVDIYYGTYFHMSYKCILAIFFAIPMWFIYTDTSPNSVATHVHAGGESHGSLGCLWTTPVADGSDVDGIMSQLEAQDTLPLGVSEWKKCKGVK